MTDDWTDYDPIPMDPFPYPASYYKERLGWCVADRCNENATEEVDGSLVCAGHKSAAENGEYVIEVIEQIDGEVYVHLEEMGKRNE